MSEYYSLAAAIFSAIATACAAIATWYAPRTAARMAERLRSQAERSQERQRFKLQVFSTLMQERAAIYSENAVRSLNLIDIVFNDSRSVRESWAELFTVFNIRPIPTHVLQEKLRLLLAAMAKDIGLSDELRADDLGRVYSPMAIEQDRLIRDSQRQRLWDIMQAQGSPAANAPAVDGPWPPRPE